MPSEEVDDAELPEELDLPVPSMGEAMAAYAAAASSDEEEGQEDQEEQEEQEEVGGAAEEGSGDASDAVRQGGDGDGDANDNGNGNDDDKNGGEDEAQAPELPPDPVDDAMEAEPAPHSVPSPQPGDGLDYARLAASFKEPLFVYPASDHPTPRLKAAYDAQKAAGERHDAARKEREDCEARAAERLGRLHNLLRESNERERKAKRELRAKTHRVYEAEMQEAPDKCEFNEMLGRLKAFVKRNKKLPPPLESLEGEEGDDEETTVLAQWVSDQQQAYEQGEVPPHHLAVLENVGVTLSLTDEDQWHRSLRKFRAYARDYYDNPLLVQATNGDVSRAIAGENHGGRWALRDWCREQQVQYQNGGFQEDMAGRYTRLVESGFAFDIFVDDGVWKEHVDALLAFRENHGHIHVPNGYAPSSSHAEVRELKEFVDRVRTLVHRDALSLKRLKHLKRAGLYLELGGRAYDQHAKLCAAGRAERDEPPRRKRRFVALGIAAGKKGGAMRKERAKRGSMGNWSAKLEKLVAYWKKHGSVADIQNDVKLRGWTFSVIRKLSINSSSLQGEKTRLIESHEGLKEHLFEKELVEAARADGGAASGARRSWGGGAGAEGEGEAKVEVEELVEDAEEKEEIV